MEPVTSTTTAPTPVSTTSSTGVTSDYETFLLMMTTQIQNQDPLDPMDSDELAVQLATFAGVEQQVQTNDLLKELTAQMSMTSLAQMGDWVGQEARVAAPVYFDGDPVTLSPNPAAAADGAVLVVTDSNGNEVARQDIPVTSADYVWYGTDADGNPLPEGVYSLSLESYAGEELLGSTSVEYYGEVLEVRSSPAGTTLMFEGGIEVPAVYVTALRPPQVA